jgi:hypothetical protein
MRDCNAAPAAMPAANTSPIRTIVGEPDNNLGLRNMILVDHNPARFAISI